jgi:hypothetical protein
MGVKTLLKSASPCFILMSASGFHCMEGALLVHASCMGIAPRDEGHTMPLINLSVQHGQNLEEARSRLEAAVHKLMSQFGALVRQVTWSDDHRWVRLDGIGCWVQL